MSEGSTVLEARILKRTRPVNDFSCVVRPDIGNVVDCQFDYLDPRDGALLEVIHTGDEKIKVIGTLRGVPKPIVVMGLRREQPKEPSGTLSPTGARIGAILLLLFGLSIEAATVINFETLGRPDVIFSVLLGSIPIFLGIALLFLIPRLPPSELSTQITSLEPKKPLLRRWIR